MTAGFRENHHTTDDGLKLYWRDYHDAVDREAGDRLPVVCLHGLTRNCEDFDDLAEHLASRRRVLTIDMRGRGRSQSDDNPMNYHPGRYAQDVSQWLNTLQVHRVAIVGTSMGGLIALHMSAIAKSLLGGLVLNDVGPQVAPAGAARLASYVGKLPQPDNLASAIANTQTVLGSALPGVPADDPVWQKLTKRTYARAPDGQWRLKSDPAIGQALAQGAGMPGPDLWQLFTNLAPVPVLCLRGAHSDILDLETVTRMRQCLPALQVCTVADRGHAPLLDEPDALQAIDRFLQEADSCQSNTSA